MENWLKVCLEDTQNPGTCTSLPTFTSANKWKGILWVQAQLKAGNRTENSTSGEQHRMKVKNHPLPPSPFKHPESQQPVFHAPRKQSARVFSGKSD